MLLFCRPHQRIIVLKCTPHVQHNNKFLPIQPIISLFSGVAVLAAVIIAQLPNKLTVIEVHEQSGHERFRKS